MRQEERRARTIRALLEAARRSFARCGYERSSLDAVAAAAGLSKGAVYVHFPTKQALFLAVARETLAEARDRVVLLGTGRHHELEAPEAAKTYFHQPDNDYEHVGLLTEVFRVALDDADVRDALSEHRDWRHEWLSRTRNGEWARSVGRLVDGETIERRIRMAETMNAELPRPVVAVAG